MNAGATQWFRSSAVSSLDWKFRFFPRFPAAGDIPKLTEALLLQNARGDTGAVTAAAINRGGFVAIELFQAFAKLWHKNVTRTGDVAFFPFAGRTHIDNLQRRLALIQFVHAHLADSFQRKPRRMPRLHSADQIAREFCVSGPDK